VVETYNSYDEIERLEEQADVRAVREAWEEQGDEEPETLESLKERLGWGQKPPKKKPARRSKAKAD
jgi:hypothetical protein